MNSTSPDRSTGKTHHVGRLQDNRGAAHAVFLTIMSAVVFFSLLPSLSSVAQGALSIGGISARINDTFGPILRPVFKPVDAFLNRLTELAPFLPSLTAIGFFVGTMLWVFLGLRKEFVNLDAPGNRLWHDLRFWTIVSMLPHVVVYFYFVK